MTFDWNNNVPGANNNPSDDQSLMLTNTQSNNSIWAIDHYGFGVANGGFHKQVRMKNQTPVAGISQSGSLVTQDNTVPGTDTNLYYTPDDNYSDGTPKIYQLTNCKNAEFSNFGSVGQYDAGPPAKFGGWTFLPGGLYLMYGYFIPTGVGNYTVPFPFTFPGGTPISVTLGYQQDNTNDVTYKLRTVSNANFVVRVSSASSSPVARWMAIGS